MWGVHSDHSDFLIWFICCVCLLFLINGGKPKRLKTDVEINDDVTLCSKIWTHLASVGIGGLVASRRSNVQPNVVQCVYIQDDWK